MTDLLPCPFCGAKAKRHDIEAREDVDNAGGSYIECAGCGACTQIHFDRKENLTDSWNRRSPHFPEQELLDLRQAFEVMQASEVLWRQTDRALRDEIAKHQTNVRHWREECGKLYSEAMQWRRLREQAEDL
jgi:Lar family restriction alleviation protein